MSCLHNKNESIIDNKVVEGDTIMTVKNFYSNGNLSEILRFKNGVKDGNSEYYNYDGLLGYTDYYDKGRLLLKSEYYEDGINLNSVKYFPNSDRNIFYKKVDSNNNVIGIESSPLVDYIISDKINKDTFFLKTIFCSFGCDSLNVEISPNGDIYKPMLFSDVNHGLLKIIDFYKEIREINHFSFYIRTACFSNGGSKIYFDTLSFKKNSL